MIFGFRLRFVFERGTPRFLIAIFYTFLANFLIFMVGVAYATFGCPRTPSASHSYAFPIGGGTFAYVPAALGFYLHWAFRAHFVLLGACFLLTAGYWATGRAMLASRR